MLDRTKIFVSYSHKDRRYLSQFQSHLGYFVREGKMDLWDDTKIVPGSNWVEEIKKAIDTAKIAVLLISADFLSSDFILSNELPSLLAAAKYEDIRILPVIIRPCAFEYTDLRQFRTVNPPSRPLSKMTPTQREEIWVEIVKIILSVLDGQRTGEEYSGNADYPTIDDLIIHGKYLNSQGNFDVAMTILQQATRLKSDSFDAWFEYTYTLIRMKHYDDAKKAFEHAKSLDPFRPAKNVLTESERESIFIGLGSGTYNHVLGMMPDEIILIGQNGSQGIRYTSITTAQVTIKNNALSYFVCLAIKHKLSNKGFASSS